ncbi:MAG TPA: NAD-dependent epimerase/dehydratase family protein, partial [Actinomycetota bacterium]|nr:NAD-dependent epimerase/dehydratase family protein [Actinomycetota bacterium]
MVKRVVLTGGAGFVGANLTRMLLDEGHEVQLLVRPGSDLWRLE